MTFKATSYEDALDSSGPVTFSLSGQGADYPLNALKIFFEQDAISKGKLITSSTSCVKENVPGPSGAYRNGALTIQILDAFDYSLKKSTGLSSGNNGFLWEMTVFSHQGGCQG